LTACQQLKRIGYFADAFDVARAFERVGVGQPFLERRVDGVEAEVEMRFPQLFGGGVLFEIQQGVGPDHRVHHPREFAGHVGQPAGVRVDVAAETFEIFVYARIVEAFESSQRFEPHGIDAEDALILRQDFAQDGQVGEPFESGFDEALSDEAEIEFGEGLDAVAGVLQTAGFAFAGPRAGGGVAPGVKIIDEEDRQVGVFLEFSVAGGGEAADGHVFSER